MRQNGTDSKHLLYNEYYNENINSDNKINENIYITNLLLYGNAFTEFIETFENIIIIKTYIQQL